MKHQVQLKIYCEKAAKSGDVRSQKLYAKQLLAKKEYEQAKYWFEEAAKKKMGKQFFNQESYIVKANLKIQNQNWLGFYYKTACELGEISACAEIDLLKQKDAQVKKAEQEKIEKKAKDDAIALEKAKVETLKAEQAKIKAETDAKIRQLEAEKKNQSQRKPNQFKLLVSKTHIVILQQVIKLMLVISILEKDWQNLSLVIFGDMQILKVMSQCLLNFFMLLIFMKDWLL